MQYHKKENNINPAKKEVTMSNNKQSSLEWYSVKRDVLEIEVRLGKLSANEYAEELAKAEQQAKAMHNTEMKEMYLKGIENYDPTFKIKDNETFGGNNEQRKKH